MFDREKKIIIIFLGGYIFLCLPPYNWNFQCFKLISIVSRTLNLRDMTLFVEIIKHEKVFSHCGFRKVPTSCGNHGKPGKLPKKVPCMEKSWNLKKPEKSWNFVK